ncbi:putative hydrogenase [Zunongwangia profunda SM-A87]|uniref:Hydrogenase n=1 Tax=Zunongwangia profunda (strain DSM 18752 / CCTCC AB 206139 / SM-A87) TaxID=655815 RepID=D5BGX9_ZUNPS|nr:Gfo/Idh/MocA family oxidoreductase [Zunongwangia profunda]ADF53310.1 putative hydrogenase [Zunongwangia profunda SM-A87]|tara:strand:+ start:2911 stop:4143 length:1233 start_codon:yes stop_codon:yes gene_type:complete
MKKNMMKNDMMKRRSFVKRSSLGALGAMAAMSVPSLNALSFSKNDSINIGVIGTGDRGGGLIPVIDEIPNLNLIACCDILPFRLERGVSRASGKIKGYSDYRKMLDNKDIDAVLVATPFSTHSAIEIDALDAGKHIYGEKTTAKGYEGIKKLNNKKKESKTIFQTGHQYHSSRLYTHVVDLIKKGMVGNITAFECQWNRHGNWRRPVPDPDLERLINWRMYREYSGGLVAELCSHQIDFVNWVMDAVPEQVMGAGGIDYWKDGRETYDNIHLIYSYPKGVKAKFTCLTSNALNDYQIKVLGDKGTIILDYENAWFYPEGDYEDRELGEVDGVSGATMQWEKGKGMPIKIEHTHSSKQALMDFSDSVLNNTQPKSDFVTGAKAAIAVQMGLDAMYNNEIVKWKKDFKDLYS